MGLELSRRAARLLLLQRTHYHPRWARPILRARVGYLYDAVASRVPAERRRLGARYEQELLREADAIAPFLPAAPRAVLDIGCGLAGIDLVLDRAYREAGHVVDRWILVDRDAFVRRPRYGYHPEGAPYNALAETSRFLDENGLEPTRVLVADVERGSFPAAGPVDAVVSLLAWGFHFPVATHLEGVLSILDPGAVVVLDVRRGTDGLAVLGRAFGRVEVVADDVKFARVACSLPRAGLSSL